MYRKNTENFIYLFIIIIILNNMLVLVCIYFVLSLLRAGLSFYLNIISSVSTLLHFNEY